MILDLAYTSKSLYASNQNKVQAYVLVRPEGHWSTNQEAFIILGNAVTDEDDVCTREKF